MTAADVTTVLVAAFALVGSALAGWMTWRGKTAELSAPAQVSAGFVALLAELRAELDRLRGRLLDLEAAHVAALHEVESLESQVEWLIARLSPLERQAFRRQFPQHTKENHNADVRE